MLKLRARLAGIVLTILLVLTAGLVSADPTITFNQTIRPPPATDKFDISFVKNGAYILADRKNNAVDLFDASTLTFAGGIGSGGFVGIGPAPAVCGVNACDGPNGVLIDNNNHIWAGDGPARFCTSPACFCFAGETTSMVKEYQLTPSSGTTGRLVCLDTGGKFRADTMALDSTNNLLIVANDFDGFLSLIKTSGTPPSIVDKFFYADNDVGQPSSAGLSTPGGGIEQPVWSPQTGFFYVALPTSGPSIPGGRVDVFNPTTGKLVFQRSIDVPGCDGGPIGLAINNSDELLGTCSNGVALINVRSNNVTILGTTAIGSADVSWFDPGSNAWYVSNTPGGQFGVVSNSTGNAIQVITQPGCCGHSIAAFTASHTQSFIFNPNAGGTGISVFKATP